MLAAEPLLARELSNLEPASGELHSELVTLAGRLYNRVANSQNPRCATRLSSLAQAFVCVVLARLVRQHPRGQEDVFKTRSMSGKIELATLAKRWFETYKLDPTYDSLGYVNRYGCDEETEVTTLWAAEDKLLTRCGDLEDDYGGFPYDKARRVLHQAVLRTGEPGLYYKNGNLTETMFRTLNRETVDPEEPSAIQIDDQELTEVAAAPFTFIIKYLQTKNEDEELALIQSDGLNLLLAGLRGGRLRPSDAPHTIRASILLRSDINLFLIFAGFTMIRPRGHYKKNLPTNFSALAGMLMQEKGCPGLDYYMRGMHTASFYDQPRQNEASRQFDMMDSSPEREYPARNQNGRGRGGPNRGRKRYNSPGAGPDRKKKKF